MKKSTKIIISCVAAALVTAGIGTGVACALKNNQESFSGTMVEEGSGEYDWKKYDVHIEIDSGKDSTKYYTNCDGDYIKDINYIRHYESTSLVRLNTYIQYKQYFNIFDDLDTFMVLSNGTKEYTTETVRCHTPIGMAAVVIPMRDVEAYDLDTYYLSEIWVKTID